jgi:hypothetical protein
MPPLSIAIFLLNFELQSHHQTRQLFHLFFRPGYPAESAPRLGEVFIGKAPVCGWGFGFLLICRCDLTVKQSEREFKTGDEKSDL